MDGFELSLSNIKFDIKGKKNFILGAGGVVPSIIFSLKKMKKHQKFLYQIEPKLKQKI